MRLYLIRHGQSEANIDPGLYQQALAPYPLTEFGRFQAQEAGRQFAAYLEKEGRFGQPLRHYVTPYLRTRQTSDLFMQNTDSAGRSLRSTVDGDEQISEEIGERQQGDYFGIAPKHYPQVRKRGTLRCGDYDRPLTDEDEAYMSAREAGDAYTPRPRKGETGKELCDRVRRFADAQHWRDGGTDGIVFAHAHSIDALLAVLTTSNEKDCEAKFNEIMNNPGIHAVGNADILQLDLDPERGVFKVTPLKGIITIPQDAKDIETIRPEKPFKVRRQLERNYQHLTPDSKGNIFGR